MTIRELKGIISHLPDEAIVLIEDRDICEVETTIIQFHSDGRAHLILGALE